MNKYEDAKSLKLTMARLPSSCERCGAADGCAGRDSRGSRSRCWSAAGGLFGVDRAMSGEGGVRLSPAEGKRLMDKWLADTDQDIRWIMKENLKKDRLARMDAGWVTKWQSQIG